MSEWISVDERLPSTKRGWAKVLAYCDKTEQYGIANFHIDNGWNDCELWDVSHWMPLPPKPTEEY